MPIHTFLDGGTINQLRGLAWMTLSETGNVLGRGTVTDDVGGGATYGYLTSDDIPCRIDALGGGEGEDADRLSDRTTHLILCAPFTGMERVDRFAIDGRGTFEITAVRERTAEWIRVLEAVPLDA
jgi:hypothetical protein